MMTRRQLPAFRRPPITLTTASNEINSLPALINYNAIHNPDHVFCLHSIFKNQPPEAHFTEVTFLELAQAVERCCAWLLANVDGIQPAKLDESGTVVQKCKPVALFLESDVGLFCYIVALLALNVPVCM